MQIIHLLSRAIAIVLIARFPALAHAEQDYLSDQWLLAGVMPPSTEYQQFSDSELPFAEPTHSIPVESHPFYDYPKLEDQYQPWEEPGYFGKSVKYLLNSRRDISTTVVAFGERMDAYFAGERFITSENNTYMRIRFSEKWIEGGAFEPDFDVKFRLDMPGTKKRYRIVLAYDDDNERSLEERSRPSQTAGPPENQSLFAGLLQTLGDETSKWESKLSAGVKVKLPPDPFLRAATMRRSALDENWEFELRSSVEWFASSGFHADSELIFERLLSPWFLFRSSTPFDWREENDTLEFGQKFSIFQDLGEKEAIAYEVGVFGTGFSNPNVDIYYISADYRRDVYKQWFFINVVPEVAFQREVDFRGIASLTISFEVFFQ